MPADDGGYDQICVTEGETFIGAAESEYYFSETKGVWASAPPCSAPACTFWLERTRAFRQPCALTNHAGILVQCQRGTSS